MAAQFDWTSLIAPVAGFGGQVLGNRMAQGMQRAALNEQKRQFDATMARRNAMFKLAAPALLRNLGYSPDRIQAIMMGLNSNVLGGRF